MHGFDRFLWRNKEDATLSEVIGRESWIQALDRDELIQQLLGEYRKPTLDLRRELNFCISLRFPTVIVCANCRAIPLLKLVIGIKLHELP
jgi:hypothetical protein